MRVLALILLSLCLAGITATAQETEHAGVETTNALVGLQVGIPSSSMQAAIRNNMGNTGFGAGLLVVSNPFAWGRNKRNGPLRIGGEIGYTYYGRFISDVNINGYTGSYKTSYGILQANALLRLQPSIPSRIRPFVEAALGGNFYLSNTKEDLSAIETAFGLQSFDLGNFASAGLNKGIAAGCAFGRKRRADEAMLVIRVSYNRGSDIKYVVRNSLRYNGSTLEYAIGRAPVEYFLVQVGIGI